MFAIEQKTVNTLHSWLNKKVCCSHLHCSKLFFYCWHLNIVVVTYVICLVLVWPRSMLIE